MGQFEIQPRINANLKGIVFQKIAMFDGLSKTILRLCFDFFDSMLLFRSAFIRVNPRLNVRLRCQELQTDYDHPVLDSDCP